MEQTMGQNKEVEKMVQYLQSEMMEYKKTRVAYDTRIQTMDAELSSCRTKLETRDTHQTDYERRTEEVIAEYQQVNDKLEEKLRKIETETQGFAREQQDTMEQLRRNREEMNTRIEKYVKLHVKHKKLQSTINDIYSKTTKYFARRGPSRQLPTPSRPTRQKRQPFARNQFGGGANNSEVSQSSDKLQRATAANTTR